MRVAFIINAPSPEVVAALREEVERLRGAGFEIHPHLTFESGDAHRLAYRAAATGASLIVAGGGDGTINEVANGLHEWIAQNRDERPRPRLGILPLGTANDLAGALQIPQELPSAIETAIHGVALNLDVARVNGRCFLNVSTGGFGAEATEEASSEVKRTLGPLAYLVTGVKKFVALEAMPARFAADSLLYDGPFLLFAVGNSRQTGGGNLLTPRADPTDGLLDLCIVKEMPRVDFLRLLPDLRAGNHLDHEAVIYEQLRHLRVEAEEMISVNADGEPLRARRLDYDISPHRLQVMIPRGTTV